MMLSEKTSWTDALRSKAAFNDFMTNYFMTHKELAGAYETPYYYEYYTVRLDSRDGLIINLTTGITAATGEVIGELPSKETRKMSIEEFRQLILNKKFADYRMSLADVFKTVAGVPSK